MELGNPITSILVVILNGNLLKLMTHNLGAMILLNSWIPLKQQVKIVTIGLHPASFAILLMTHFRPECPGVSNSVLRQRTEMDGTWVSLWRQSRSYCWCRM